MTMSVSRKKGFVFCVCHALMAVFLFGLTDSGIAKELQVGTYLNPRPLISYWDPSETIGEETVVFNNTYETLLRYDPSKEEFEPVLAKSFTSSKDKLKWTFHLRKGVKFHTGNDMDAEAVKFSVERTMRLKKGAYYIWPAMKSVETPDKYTVVFNLEKAARLDLSVSSAYGAHIFDPKFATRDWFYKGNECGTGPYKIESVKGKELIILTKFEEYWGGWKGQHFDKVVMKTVEEASTRRLMIESGKADITSRLPISMIQAMKNNPEIEIIQTGSFQNLNALFNMAKSKNHPISNPDIRKLLAYTLPYKDIVDEVLEGYGTEARGIIPKKLWGFSNSVRQYTYSPAIAKFYLEKAGYPEGGIKLELIYTAGDQQMRRVAELWKAELAKLNVELGVRGMPWTAQSEVGHRTNPDERQDIYMLYWWPDFAHPHSFMSSQYETKEPPIYNFSYYKNPVYDRLIKTANEQSAVNLEEGINLYAEAQNLLMEELPGLSIYDVDYTRAKRKSLKGYVDNPAYAHVVFWYNTHRGR